MALLWPSRITRLLQTACMRLIYSQSRCACPHAAAVSVKLSAVLSCLLSAVCAVLCCAVLCCAVCLMKTLIARS